MKVNEWTCFKWHEWLKQVDYKYNLDRKPWQFRAVFLQGFPPGFESIVEPERMKPAPGTYLLPGVYPAHHPQSGQVHPRAGACDMDALVRAFHTSWVRMIKSGRIKSAPRGSVYSATEANPSASEGESSKTPLLTTNETVDIKSEAEQASVSFCESASEGSDEELNALAAAAADCDINDDEVNEARAIAHAARTVTNDDVCVVCGGRGH